MKLLSILTNFIFNKKKLVLIIWLSLIILFLFISSKTEYKKTELDGLKNTESYRIFQILENNFDIKLGNSSAIVFKGDDKNNELKNSLAKNFSQIAKITEIKGKTKHKQRLYYIDFKKDVRITDAQKLTKDIRIFLDKWEKKTGIKTYITGNNAFYFDADDTGSKDSRSIEIFALSITFFILIFNFGNVLSAMLPILMGITTIIYVNALVKIIGIETIPLSLILDSLVGLALAIDYSLFIVSRFREELRTKDDKEALLATITNTGKTIIFSALIMFISVSVLLIPDVSFSRSVVKNLLLVILISTINSLLFLPVFLIYGKNIIEKVHLFSNLIKYEQKYIFWKKFAQNIVKYPKTYFILSVTSLLILSYPILNMKLWEPVQTLAPKESESMQGYKLLEKDSWGGELIPINIVIKSKNSNVFTKEFISSVYDLTNAMKKNNKVAYVDSITSINPNFTKDDYFTLYNTLNNFGLLSQRDDIKSLVNINSGSNITLINIYPKDLMTVDDTYEIVKFAKEYIKNNINNPNYDILVGGVVSRAKEFTNELYNYIPQMLIIILLSIFTLLYLYMKSIVLPIKAGIMNFLPILGAFGILTLVFQYGYASNILNTPENHAVTYLIPIILFCIVFGLSMDYEVLILSRITEFYENGYDVKSSIVEGLANSGSVITGAALILLSVFTPGIFSSYPLIKELCIGIVSAIFLDATIVRLLLVPSFMILLGKWNWWKPFNKN